MPDYTLYELSPAGGMANRFSPFVWRTKSDLALLDIQYKAEPYTFGQIRKELAAATGDDKVTVPTLQSADGYVTGSNDIAEYLDKHHPGTLFPDASAHTLGYVLDRWVDTQLVGSIMGLFRPLVFYLLDKAGREYYIAVKNGPREGAREVIYNQLMALDDPKQVAELGAAGRAKLKFFEDILAKSDGPFVLGAKASHADSSFFGAFAFSQLNADVVNRELWKHESLPHIARWVDAMVKRTKFESPFTALPSKAEREEILKELK